MEDANTPFDNLAIAICAQAADDYRAARHALKWAEEMEADCRAFFAGDAVEHLTGGDGPSLLAMLDREPVPAGSRRAPPPLRPLLSSVRSALGAAADAARRGAEDAKAAADELDRIADALDRAFRAVAARAANGTTPQTNNNPNGEIHT